MSIALGVTALIAAVFIDRVRLGPEWLRDRIAAVLVVAAAGALLSGTRVGRWIVQAGEWLVDTAGDLLSAADPQIGQAVAAVGIGLLAAGAGLYWLLAMLPGKATKVVGEAADMSFATWIIYGAGPAMVVFGTATPGPIGEFLRALFGMAGNVGTGVVGGVF